MLFLEEQTGEDPNAIPKEKFLKIIDVEDCNVDAFVVIITIIALFVGIVIILFRNWIQVD